MIVFGDSLSDTGHIPAFVAQFDGYTESNGRFTSSPTSSPPSAGTGVWHEVLATKLGIAPATPSPSGSNWAYGGAQTGEGVSSFGYVHNVGQQVSDYLSASSNTSDGNALYCIWAGGDDLLDAADSLNTSGMPVDPQALDATAATAVANLDGYIQTFITDGARYILWPNLPELDQTPYARGWPAGSNNGYLPAVETALANAVATFNTDWASAIGSLRSKDPNVTIYGLDVHTAFAEMLDGTYPGDTFSDVTDPASKVTPTPASADTYLFWDEIHPTEEAHKLLGDAAYSLIESTVPRGNVIRIVRDAAVPGNADVFIDNTTSTPTYTVALAGISQWQVFSSAGNEQLIVDFSNGDPLPAGGLVYNGGTSTTGNTLSILGISRNDKVTDSGSQVTVDGSSPISYSNVGFLGIGTPVAGGTSSGGTVVAQGTLIATGSSAVPAGTSLTVGSSGTFDFDPSIAGSNATAANATSSAASMAATGSGAADAVWLASRADSWWPDNQRRKEDRWLQVLGALSAERGAIDQSPRAVDIE